MFNDRENNEMSRFNLSLLKIIFDEIKSCEIQRNFIQMSSFIEIYLKKYVRNLFKK